MSLLYYATSAQHVLLVKLGWLWDRKLATMQQLFCGALLTGFISKQHVASLYNSYLALSLCISLVSMWCIHTVAWKKFHLILPERFTQWIYVSSSPCIRSAYIDIVFCRWDIAAELYELTDTLQRTQKQLFVYSVETPISFALLLESCKKIH